MRNRFQLGFLLGSLIPLAAVVALGHSPRVCLAAGAGFAVLPALLWPRRVSGWLSGIGEFYERVTSRPARSGGRQNPVSGPRGLRSPEGWPVAQMVEHCAGNSEVAGSNPCPVYPSGDLKSRGTANANPTPESARRRQDVVSALRNFGCPKPKAVAIATAVADISDEKEQLYAAMRMVRA